MRFATPFVALIAAALLTGCNAVSAPKPDPAGDAGFVAALKLLCSKTPAVVPINPSASKVAITNAANAGNATVLALVYGTPVRAPDGRTVRHGGIASLTPMIANSSPLVPSVTHAASMLLDMSKWYTLIVKPPKAGRSGNVSVTAGIIVARENEARSDLAKIGITGCPSS